MPQGISSASHKTMTTTCNTPAPATQRTSNNTSRRPKADIVETSVEYTLKADMPGVGRDNLTVKVVDNKLTLQGNPNGVQAGTAMHREIRTAPYEMSLLLESDIDTTAIKAAISQGVVTVRLPKKATAKPMKISVV